MIATNLRLPDDLHAQLKELAARERRSLNTLIVVLLERAIQAERDVRIHPRD